MQFEIATPARIRLGSGLLAEVPSLAAEMGRRAFVVTGSDPRRADRLIAELERCDVFTTDPRREHSRLPRDRR